MLDLLMQAFGDLQLVRYRSHLAYGFEFNDGGFG
jgi:hypothetical protein